MPLQSKIGDKIMQIGDVLKEDDVIVNFGQFKFFKSMLYNIYGEEMTSKSAICLYIANELKKNGFNVLFFETENKLKGYEAVRSIKYKEGIDKVLLGDYPIFVPKKITDRETGNEKIVPDFSQFKNKIKIQIDAEKVNAVIIDSISKPLISYHFKIASAAITNFFNDFREIILEKELLGIVVSHAREDYNSTLKKVIWIPRGSQQSRYLVKRMMTKKITGDKTHNIYSLTYHNTVMTFDINDDGTIDSERIG